MTVLYEKIKVIHFPTEREPFAILDKPRGLPSAPLKEGDPSALTWALEKFPEIKNVVGKKNIEYGLVHRIDTETRGLLLVACSQKFYNEIIAEQTNGRFIKSYEAECREVEEKDLADGFTNVSCNVKKILNGLKNHTANEISVVLSSRFRPYGIKNKEVRPVIESSGKAAVKKASEKKYSTSVMLARTKAGTVEAICSIAEGYRHQVRCHLAWIGFPVKNDRLYDPHASNGEDFSFTAVSLEFLGLKFSL